MAGAEKCPLFLRLRLARFRDCAAGAGLGADFSGKGKNLRKFFPRVRQAGTKIFFGEKGNRLLWRAFTVRVFFCFPSKKFLFPVIGGDWDTKKVREKRTFS